MWKEEVKVLVWGSWGAGGFQHTFGTHSHVLSCFMLLAFLKLASLSLRVLIAGCCLTRKASGSLWKATCRRTTSMSLGWHFRLQAIFVILSVEDLFQDDKLQPKTVAVTAASAPPKGLDRTVF